MALQTYYNKYGNMYGGVTPTELALMGQYESSNNPSAMNNWDSNAQAGTPSGGVLQFIAPTFESFLSAAQQDNPQVYGQWSANDWLNPEAQVAVAAHAIDRGMGSHWTTYDRARQAAASGEAPQYGQSQAPVRSSESDSARIGTMSPQQALMAQIFSEDPGVAESMSKTVAPRMPISGAQGQRTRGSRTTAGLDYADFPRLQGEPVWKWAQRMGQSMFGLQNEPGTGQTFGGQHAPGSLHYDERAIDWGNARNTQEQLQQAYDYYNQYRDRLGVTELIWQQPGHYDHLHVGF